MLRIGLLQEIYDTPGHAERLVDQLKVFRKRGVDLVVLPELPFNAWSPATRRVNPDDAEHPGGWRETMQVEASKAAGVAVLGGVIRLDENGRRENVALLTDSMGQIVATQAKLHLPDEDGFWECDHYEPGTEPPRVIPFLDALLGIQICSDANRPTGAQLLGAQGVQVVLAPRATNPATWHRWRLAYRAMAMINATWVVSVGRPCPEDGPSIGGPSLVVNPMGEVVHEAEVPLAEVDMDVAEADRARLEYPGYLAQPAEVYVAGWNEISH